MQVCSARCSDFAILVTWSLTLGTSLCTVRPLSLEPYTKEQSSLFLFNGTSAIASNLTPCQNKKVFGRISLLLVYEILFATTLTTVHCLLRKKIQIRRKKISRRNVVEQKTAGT